MNYIPDHIIIEICIEAYCIDNEHLEIPYEWSFVYYDMRYWMELYARFYDINYAIEHNYNPNWKELFCYEREIDDLIEWPYLRKVVFPAIGDRFPLGKIKYEKNELLQLRSLNIIGNANYGDGISTLPYSIIHLTNLQKLFLPFNKFKKIPEEILTMTHLVELNMSYNRLEYISPQIASLTRLVDLDISSNHLTDLPESLSTMTQLRYLRIYDNDFFKIPQCVHKLIKSNRDLLTFS